MVKNRLLAVCGVLALAVSGAGAAAAQAPPVVPDPQPVAVPQVSAGSSEGTDSAQAQGAPGEVGVSQEQVFSEGGQLYAVGAEKNYVLTHGGKLVHAFADSTPQVTAATAEQVVGAPVTWHGPDGDHVVVRTAAGGLQHFSWDRAHPDQRSAGFVASSDVADDPAAATMSGQYHIFYVSSAGHLMQRLWDPGAPEGMRGSSWTEAASEEPVFVKGRPSVFEWNGQQHVFVRAADDTLAHFWWDPAVGKIQVGTWGEERAYADVTTLAGKDSQTVFYVNYVGQLKRATWHATNGWEPEQNWSISEAGGGKGIVGRPQSFGVGDQQHVLARHHDGSVTHFMKTASTDVHQWEWLPPGTVDTDIAAAALNGDQDLFVTDRAGQRRHVWWSPNAEKTAHEYWGERLPMSARPALAVPAEPQLDVTVLDEDAVVGTRSNPDGSAQLLSLTRDGAVHTTELRSGADGAASVRRVGVWSGADGTAEMAVTSPAGDVMVEVRQVDGTPVGEPGLTLIDALGSVASAPVTVDGKQARQLAVVTKAGVLTAVAAPGEPVQWRPILRSLDGLTPMIEMVPTGGAAAVVFARATNGHMLVAAAQGSQAVWEMVPLLPGDQTVAGEVSAVTSADGVLYVAATDAQGQVFVNRTHGQGWLGWVPVGAGRTVGTPQVAVHPQSGGVVVVSRDEAQQAVVSTSADGAAFTDFEVAAHAGGEPPVFASDVHVVPTPVNETVLATVGVTAAGEVVPGVTLPKSQQMPPGLPTDVPTGLPTGAPSATGTPGPGMPPQLPGRTVHPQPDVAMMVPRGVGVLAGELTPDASEMATEGVSGARGMFGGSSVPSVTFPPTIPEGDQSVPLCCNG